MSDMKIGVNDFFERGLDNITYANTTEVTNLPPQSELAPAEMRSQMLAQLLSLPNIASFLEEAIRPDIEDREQLVPGRFRQALTATLSALNESAEALQESDPEGAKLLNRAIRVLREDASLRELVQMYRSAVHQG